MDLKGIAKRSRKMKTIRARLIIIESVIVAVGALAYGIISLTHLV